MNETGPWGYNQTPSEQTILDEGDPMKNGITLLQSRLSQFAKKEQIQIIQQTEKCTPTHAILTVVTLERFDDVKKRLDEIAHNVNRYLKKKIEAEITVTGDAKSGQIDIVAL